MNAAEVRYTALNVERQARGNIQGSLKVLTNVLALEEDHSDLVSGCCRRFLFLPIFISSNVSLESA